MAPVMKSYGQRALRSRAASVVPNGNLTSVVNRLINWAITGRALDHTAHQHYDFHMHFE